MVDTEIKFIHILNLRFFSKKKNLLNHSINLAYFLCVAFLEL